MLADIVISCIEFCQTSCRPWDAFPNTSIQTRGRAHQRSLAHANTALFRLAARGFRKAPSQEPRSRLALHKTVRPTPSEYGTAVGPVEADPISAGLAAPC
jgi:hypothetical protein